MSFNSDSKAHCWPLETELFELAIDHDSFLFCMPVVNLPLFSKFLWKTLTMMCVLLFCLWWYWYFLLIDVFAILLILLYIYSKATSSIHHHANDVWLYMLHCIIVNCLIIQSLGSILSTFTLLIFAFYYLFKLELGFCQL